MRVAAIVVAAGSGERFGAAKQFLSLGSSSITAHSVAAARSVASFVIVVVPAEYDGRGEGADVVVEGGATRSASVRSGLAHCAGYDAVVIHDAARPLASSDLFHRVVDALGPDVDGAIPGVAVVDTLKMVSGSLPATVLSTVDRDTVVAVQTPQAFRLSALRTAHASGLNATDDAALLEEIGATVIVVAGETSNRKITTPDDLVWVQTQWELA